MNANGDIQMHNSPDWISIRNILMRYILYYFQQNKRSHQAAVIQSLAKKKGTYETLKRSSSIITNYSRKLLHILSFILRFRFNIYICSSFLLRIKLLRFFDKSDIFFSMKIVQYF